MKNFVNLSKDFLNWVKNPYPQTPTLGERIKKIQKRRHQKKLSNYEHKIRLTAYYLWEADQKPEGMENYYWYKAKEEVDSTQELIEIKEKIKSKQISRWFLFEFLPFTTLLHRIVNARKSNFFLWVLGIHFAAFSIALTQFEARKDSVETQLAIITSQDKDSNATLRQIIDLQHETIPVDPSNIIKFWRVYVSLFGEEQINPNIIDTTQDFIENQAKSGQGFKNANLKNAILKDADLRGAKFVKSDLRCANLKGANLNNAKFLATDLDGLDCPEGSTTNLKNVRMIGTLIKYSYFNSVILEGADLSNGTVVEFSNFENVNFKEANLEDIYLKNVNLRGSNFQEADLSGLITNVGSAQKPDYIDSFNTLYGERAFSDLVRDDSYINFGAANLKGTILAGATLQNATLTDIFAEEARNLEDALLCDTTMPNGEEVDKDCDKLKDEDH